MELTLKDCYNNDTEGISSNSVFPITKNDENGNKIHVINIDFKISFPWIGDKVRFFIYVPETPEVLDICFWLMKNYKDYQSKSGVIKFQTGNAFKESLQIGNSKPDTRDYLYFYTENEVTKQNFDWTPFEKLANDENLTVFFRDENYRQERLGTINALAFISHDSKDKELIARPIAEGMTRKLLKVWYDEYSLNVGDSLRESIEKGIRESEKCILILTPNFLNNPGWTKKEFDSIFTKELVEKKKVILPIWHNVSVKDVYDYSPSLANTVALHWPEKSLLDENGYKKSMEQIVESIIRQLKK